MSLTPCLTTLYLSRYVNDSANTITTTTTTTTTLSHWQHHGIYSWDRGAEYGICEQFYFIP